MTTTDADRSHEGVINDALARVMREHIGLNVVAETLSRLDVRELAL